MTFKSMLQAAQHVVFLTGAGVSTASGIPDYRSKTGLYHQQANPEYLLSHTNLITNPTSFFMNLSRSRCIFLKQIPMSFTK